MIRLNQRGIEMRLLLCLCLFTVSCSNKDQPINTEPIQLSTNSVHLIAGEKRIVHILSDLQGFGMGNYGLQSEDKQIATAMWMNGNRAIQITANNMGNTSIYLRDIRNPNNFAKIDVTSDYFSGEFRENGDSSIINAQAADLFVREAIENELRNVAHKRSGILFSFNKKTKAVNIDYSRSAYEIDKKVGLYEWGKDCLTLTVDNSISQHGFAVVNDHAVILELDFLEKYKSEYPEASVKAAKIGCFLSSIE